MQKTITTIAALAISAAFLTAAEDAPKPDATKGEKKKYDPAAAFAKLDSNNDGCICADEWKASPMAKKDAAKAEEQWKKKDKDGDGKLTKDEFMPPKKEKKQK